MIDILKKLQEVWQVVQDVVFDRVVVILYEIEVKVDFELLFDCDVVLCELWVICEYFDVVVVGIVVVQKQIVELM